MKKFFLFVGFMVAVFAQIQAQTIITDSPDYPPGDTVNIN